MSLYHASVVNKAFQELKTVEGVWAELDNLHKAASEAIQDYKASVKP
jgi:hypothetical protein